MFGKLKISFRRTNNDDGASRRREPHYSHCIHHQKRVLLTFACLKTRQILLTFACQHLALFLGSEDSQPQQSQTQTGTGIFSNDKLNESNVSISSVASSFKPR